MFANESFTSLSRAARTLKPLWGNWCKDAFSQLESLYSAIESNSPSEMAREAHMRFFDLSVADIFEKRLLQTFSDKMWICSPQGIQLRFDAELFVNHDIWWWVNIVDIAKLDEPYRTEIVERALLFEYPVDEFLSDQESLVENPDKDSLWELSRAYGLTEQFMNVPSWFERESFTISFRMLDLLERGNLVDVHPCRYLAETCSVFDGWALCVKDVDLEDVVEDFDSWKAPETEVERSSANNFSDVSPVDRILKGHKEGLNKQEIKSKYFPNCSYSQYKYFRKRAAELDPTVERSGRKPIKP